MKKRKKGQKNKKTTKRRVTGRKNGKKQKQQTHTGKNEI